MSEYSKPVILRRRLAGRWLYGTAVFLLASALLYGAVIALGSTQVESAEDRAGIRTSIAIAASIAAVGTVVAVAAFLISRSAGRSKTR
jgi:hypothetical protein